MTTRGSQASAAEQPPVAPAGPLVEAAALTPMMRQYLETKASFPEAILFFRLGDFYEMFFEDAVRAAELLQITLTARSKGDDRVPMCGVPHHSVRGCDDLPLAEALQWCGVDLLTEAAPWAASLGLRLTESPLTGVNIEEVVLAGSAAAAAGLSAGDELLAVDGWRVRRFEDARQCLHG